MRPSMFLGGDGVPSAQFVGSGFQSIPPGDTAIDFSGIPSMAVHDYVFLFFQAYANGPYMTGLPGWDQDNYTWGGPYASSVRRRRITTLEPPVVRNAGFSTVSLLIGAYRGVSRASRKSVASSPGNVTSLTIPGFKRSTDCVGAVSVLFDRDGGSANFSPSAGWTRRAIQTVANYRGALADALPKGAYVDDANVTWSGVQSGSPEFGLLYEMRL